MPFKKLFWLFWPLYYHSFLNRKLETLIKVPESESFLKIKKLFGISEVKIAFKKLFGFLIKKECTDSFVLNSEINSNSHCVIRKYMVLLRNVKLNLRLLQITFNTLDTVIFL